MKNLPQFIFPIIFSSSSIHIISVIMSSSSSTVGELEDVKSKIAVVEAKLDAAELELLRRNWLLLIWCCLKT